MTSRAAEILKIHEYLGSFLTKRFFSLSSFSRRSIARALSTPPTNTKRNSPPEPMESASIRSEPLLSASSTSTEFPLLPPAELDARLPKVCEALVLITQCIVTISLEAEKQRELLQEGRSTLTKFTNMKNYFNEKKSSDHQGIVESLIGLYCFSKRITNCDKLSNWFLAFVNFFFGWQTCYGSSTYSYPELTLASLSFWMDYLHSSGLKTPMGFIISNGILYVYWAFYAMACGLCRTVLGWQEAFLS